MLCPQRSSSELNVKELKLFEFLLISAKFREEVRLKAPVADLYSSRAFWVNESSRSFFPSSLFLTLSLSFSLCLLFHESLQPFLFLNICYSRTLASCDTTLFLLRSHVFSIFATRFALHSRKRFVYSLYRI